MLFETGADQAYLKRHLIAHDGELVTDVKEATHLITGLERQSDELKEQVERNPHVKVVATGWVRDSIAKGTALPTDDYLVPL